MITVKRANVVLTIEDGELDKYFEKGYSVIDQFGNVIKASVPTEVGALQKALQDKEVEITALKKEIERLEAENKVLAMVINQSAPVEIPAEETVEEPKKKSTYKRKTAQ